MIDRTTGHGDDARIRTAAIVPSPSDVRSGDGHFAWTEGLTVSLDVLASIGDIAAGTLVNGLTARGLAVPAPADGSAPASVVIGRRDCCPALVGLGARPPYLGTEGYWLRVTGDRVVLMGETDAGVYYGVQTLLALLGDGVDARLPVVEVTDRPALGLRGFMQDIGRGLTPTLDSMTRTVEVLGSLKMNAYFLYLEDGFLFESHPDIGAHRDRVTAADIRALVSVAARHHVRIIPIIETLGHMEAILAVPAHMPLREGDDERGRKVMNPLHPGSLQLLDDLIGDICDCFIDVLVGVGGDETFGLGSGRSAAAAGDLTTGDLFTGHYRRVREMVQKRGRTMILWTDQLEPDFFKPFPLDSVASDNLDTLPRDIVLSSWHYGEVSSFDFAARLEQLGIPLLYWGAVEDSEIFPRLDGAARNAASYFAFAHRHAAIGGGVSQWHVGPDTHTFPQNGWSAVAYFGEWMWSSAARHWEAFLPLALRHLYGDAGDQLVEGHRVLATANDALPWAAHGLRAAGHAEFFDAVPSRRLDEESLRLVVDLGRRVDEAIVVADVAIPRCTRNRDILPYYRFALQWTRALVEVVGHRHRVAVGAPGDAGATATVLVSLREEYARLYLAANRPIGLDANARAFLRVEAAVEGGVG